MLSSLLKKTQIKLKQRISKQNKTTCSAIFYRELIRLTSYSPIGMVKWRVKDNVEQSRDSNIAFCRNKIARLDAPQHPYGSNCTKVLDLCLPLKTFVID